MSGRASIGDYIVTSKLGSGSFAVVYKGYHKTSKTPVAIKALSLHKLNGKLLSNLEMEIAIMRQIDHPNVVKLYEIKKTDKHMYLVLEFCAGGDLQHYMRRQQQQNGAHSLTEDVARHFLRELAKGMQCLWQHNLIHRDLKPQNLLLVEDSPTSILKIADFGFARHLATASMAETLCGSPLYMAPEILKFQKYDAKADLWSVGTILFEMVAGRPPYGGANHVQLLANIERQPLRFPSTLQLSRPCHHLLVALLQRKPALRLGFSDFFADIFVDLQPVLDQSEIAETATIQTTAGIIEDEERRSTTEMGGDQDAESTRQGSGSDRRSRTFSGSHAADSSPRFSRTAPPVVLHHSRSGNLEVMETAFARASSGSGAMRRSSSSRLARSRRTSSSGTGLVGTTTGTSPKRSPQMSPHIFPCPSLRINPFKELSDSSVLQLQRQQSLSGSSRSRNAIGFQSGQDDAIGTAKVKNVIGGGHALDSSGEYVLVDELSERVANGVALSHQNGETNSGVPCLSSQGELVTRALASAGSANAPVRTFCRDYGQQLIDIVVLRIQAIAPLADQLWTLSAGGDGSSGCRNENADEVSGRGDWSLQQQSEESSSSSESGEKRAGSANFSNVFSMGSSLTSSIGVSHALGDDLDGDDDDDEKHKAKRQYMCAAEALVLYIKCLQLVQRVAVYFRYDQVSRGPIGSSGSPAAGNIPGWGDTSRKISIGFLSEQLTHFLDRAEQCKARMAHAAHIRTPLQSIASQEELLYSHALRIGRQGAIREVLGQSRAAHDHYLQALLLLNSLLMDASGASVSTLAVDDHKNVNTLLRAIELRLKNVRTLFNDESSDSSARDLQRIPHQQHKLTYLYTAAVL